MLEEGNQDLSQEHGLNEGEEDAEAVKDGAEESMSLPADGGEPSSEPGHEMGGEQDHDSVESQAENDAELSEIEKQQQAASTGNTSEEEEEEQIEDGQDSHSRAAQETGAHVQSTAGSPGSTPQPIPAAKLFSTAVGREKVKEMLRECGGFNDR